MSTELILAKQESSLPTFSLGTVAEQMRENALVASALIGKVETGDQNAACFKARKNIKSLLSLVEAERTIYNKPLLEAQRALKRMTETFCLDLEKEQGRLENLERQFQMAENRRAEEERQEQQRKLDEIEEKRLADLAAAKTDEQKEVINQRAEEAAYVESRPVEVTRAKGQVVREDWEIDQINDFQLVKHRPDLVRRFEWDMVGIKQALNSGLSLPGVRARKVTKIGARGPNNLQAIDVPAT
jgi:hypothetical protein